MIAATGILPVLYSLVEHDEESLTVAHCEFLQACIYAEQHAVAESYILHTWPRPSSSSSSSTVKISTVLRYFYLRGVVHMRCHHWNLAVRCFWTCLSIPAVSDANAVSAISVAAWKKLVLVQCIQTSSHVLPTSSPTTTSSSSSKSSSSTVVVHGGGNAALSSSVQLATPKEMAAGLSRFLSTAKPPLGSHSLKSETSSSSPIASPLRPGTTEPDDPPDAMHFVEVEGEMPANHNDDDDTVNGTGRYTSLGVYVYTELVKAYAAIDRSTFDAIVQEHARLFREDGNLGLVRRVDTALIHRQVYEMSTIYASIAQDQLAAELGLSTEQLQLVLSQLLVVAEKNAWPVTIQDNVVIFPKAPPLPDVDAAATTTELVQLTKTVELLDVAIASSSTYSTALHKELAALEREKSGGPRGVEDV